MKTRTKNLTTLSSIVAAVSLLAATSAFGQATFTWTNAAGGDIATAVNWDPNGVPQPITGDPGALGIYGDEMLWDGRTTTDLVLTANTGQGGFSSGLPEGLRIRLSSNQTNAVTIRSVVPISAGTRLNSITIEPGAGAFHMGDPTTVNVWDFLGGASNPATHTWINDSTNAATVHPNVRHRLGAGGAHTFDFGGSGDWIVNNYFRNHNNSATLIAKSGTGTMYWTGTNVPNAFIGHLIAGPVTINDGTLVLKSSDLLAAQGFNHNGGVLQYDAPTGAGVLSGTINGVGSLVISAGTLTLSGANTFSGNIALNGGELIAGRVETVGVNGPLGQLGIISFAGGTLAYGPNNNFDYSDRFSTSAGQAYRINTAGRNVNYATGLTSSGGTLNKLGSGTLTLAGGNAFSGATTVSAGRLVIGGSFGSGAITVADNAALGVVATGGTVTPTSLTVGTSGSATLEFNAVTSTTTPLITAGSVSAGGTITVNVNSGVFAVGQSYPLFSWTGGAAPAVSLGTLVGAVGELVISGNSVRLNVTGLAYVWSGAASGVWDTATANNWLQSGSPAVFVNGSAALFDETAPGELNVTVNAPVTPASTTVNSATKNYTITSSGANAIGGPGGLTKNANSVLTLAGGANTYSGATTINGGSISVGALANGGGASDIGASGNGAANLVLNGGALEYTGGAQSSDRLFTLGTAGGEISSAGFGALSLNNAGAVALGGAGARTLTLAGANVEDNILAAALADSGGATALTKAGDGKWIVSGNNAISGTVTISGGTLQVGNGGATGTVGSGNILNNGALIFNRTGAVTNGVVTGTGSVLVNGGVRAVLPGNNTYSGGTTIQPGSTLQVGNGGATGALNGGQTIQNDGTLIFDTTGTHMYTGNGFIAGSGNVIVRGAGRIKAIAANSYTGWTLIEPGATFQPTEGNSGQLFSSVVTNNGTLMFVSQDPRPPVPANIVGSGRVRMGANNFNAGSVTLHGSNTYTGGTFIGCNELIFGDGATPGSGHLVGDVTFVNNFDTPDDNLRTLTFNRPDDFTFSGNITTNFSSAQINQGRVRQMGSGVLTLTGNNNYAGGTLIEAGTVQVGNGGTSGSIGFGAVENNGILVWNRSDDIAFGGNINGFGAVVKRGAGTLTLSGALTTFGATTVSNGTLVLVSGNVAGELYLEGGTYRGGAANTVITNNITGSLLVNSGKLVATVNTSLAESNTVYAAAFVSVTTGTLEIVNAGPTLVVGQKFTIFNQPVSGGNSLTVTGGGATWTNDLETDGSITVATVTAPPAPPTLNVTPVGNNLQFTWTGSFKLQAQTNSLSVGLSNNWGDYPGGGTSGVSVPVNVANETVFFRLVSTP
jgi:fibronectin-binding autotransporter adhesin